MPTSQQKDERLHLQYQTAQGSAQHHDSLAWTTTGIVWGANLVLLGFVLASFTQGKVKVLSTIMSVLGILLIAAVWRFVRIWQCVRLRKYNVCQQIEESEEFEHSHHLGEKSDYPSGEMSLWYGVISVAFLLTWLGIIVMLWCPAS